MTDYEQMENKMTPLTAGSEVLTSGALLHWDGKSWTVLKLFDETQTQRVVVARPCHTYRLAIAAMMAVLRETANYAVSMYERYFERFASE